MSLMFPGGLRTPDPPISWPPASPEMSVFHLENQHVDAGGRLIGGSGGRSPTGNKESQVVFSWGLYHEGRQALAALDGPWTAPLDAARLVRASIGPTGPMGPMGPWALWAPASYAIPALALANHP